MPHKTEAWTSEQLEKMNEEGFMVDFLDTFKISPEIDESDSTVNEMKEKLDRVESIISDH